ncbi:MAG: DNA polymerase III subunit delta [Chloroflexi bacterium RBG_19FT_COMBO_50_10]|nr:MAG: DNA polymerase III subunit delta [Chloroflexi bacterium RBG_19FT_COMBO_50_10]
MVEEGPIIYIFDGDDEVAINESVEKIRIRLGDTSIAEMNTTRLDGRSYSMRQLEDAVATVPFLASKRLVIISHPPARLNDKQGQENFIHFLNAKKPTTKLILVDYEFLTSEQERRAGKLNWLEKWATSPEQEKRVFLRHHPQPSGPMMVKWIQEHARSMGGQFSPQAAVSLAHQIGDDTRVASQEITKLLTYVNFARPVDPDDVEHLTPFTAKIGDFDLVNALRDKDRRKAQALLQRSLEDNDPLQILHSIVFQIRSLIIAREILDEHGTVNDFPKSLKIGYYPARLALESAPRYSHAVLDLIYHRLLELDEAIKTGHMDADLALELLVIELTA